MAHYAFLDENNFVTGVIVGKDEGDTDWEAHYSQVQGQTCKRTSYNTYGGTHNAGGVPFRKNFAGVGFKYDAELDAFIPPQPYPSWRLNTTTCLWESPVPHPEDRLHLKWSEEQLNWVEVEV